MALVKCSECGKDISTSAKACPNCGAKLKRPGSGLLKLLGWGIVIVLFFAALPALFIDSPGPPTPEKTAQKRQPSSEEKKRTAQLQLAGLGALTLKKTAKDPESFRLQSAFVKPNGVACFEFRGKNSFGADIPGQAVMLQSGNVYTNNSEDNTRFAAAWNGDCTKAGGDDIAPMLRLSR